MIRWSIHMDSCLCIFQFLCNHACFLYVSLFHRIAAHVLFSIDWTQQWTTWSVCNVTCGHGSKTRSRQCRTVNNDTVHSSSCKYFLGSNDERKGCTMKPCEGKGISQVKIVVMFEDSLIQFSRSLFHTLSWTQISCRYLISIVALVKEHQRFCCRKQTFQMFCKVTKFKILSS